MTESLLLSGFHQPTFLGSKLNPARLIDEVKQQLRPKLFNNQVILTLCQNLKKPRGVHSTNAMQAAGFYYTDESTVRCDKCDLLLSVSDWTREIQPFAIHAEKRPDCSYVLSMRGSIPIEKSVPVFPLAATTSPGSTSATGVRSASVSNELENPSKRQKVDSNNQPCPTNNLCEAKQLENVRKRTFSHWPHRTVPSKAQMIEAGFFNCNVGDRVICIYCNLICQQWTPHTDDPCEVHKVISPQCIYVKAKLLRRETGTILIVNDTRTETNSESRPAGTNSQQEFRGQGLVNTAACNPAYTEIPRRFASFATWSSENLPPVDDLVRAGFFYTGTKTIVTCFYCNGSLQNWGPNDNPTIEHARWFPHCAYAKQLCGDVLYRKIQESKRAQQERVKASEVGEKMVAGGAANGAATTNAKLLIPDESTLSRLVAARLDLPISQSLLAKKFKLSIIKRCWEDQLRLKQDDFENDCELFMACLILQKQIEYIDGKKENIIIPSKKIKEIRDNANRERAEALAREQPAAATAATNMPPPQPNTAGRTTEMDTTTSSQTGTNETTSSIGSISPSATTSSDEERKQSKSATSAAANPNSAKEPVLANPCVICLEAEKGLACIPCGHLATCVPCGHSMRSCPICRREIEAYVRVYV